MGEGGFDSPESVPPVAIRLPSRNFVATPLISYVQNFRSFATMNVKNGHFSFNLMALTNCVHFLLRFRQKKNIFFALVKALHRNGKIYRKETNFEICSLTFLPTSLDDIDHSCHQSLVRMAVSVPNVAHEYLSAFVSF